MCLKGLKRGKFGIKKSELVARFFGASLPSRGQARLAKDLLVFVAI